jgi:LuxR family maltose regulon positive regulatory protein
LVRVPPLSSDAVQTTSVSLTKIQPPRVRSNSIERVSLERRLAEALASRRLTLMSAPAGFGKTTALTRQLAILPRETAVAWIAADEDDDLHRFLVSLFAALEPFDLPWRTAPEALIAEAASADRNLGAVATGLLNALAGSDVPRGLIVIDDAHRITDAAVFEFVDLMLERLPANWGFVISSRVDPPLALARLRAQDDLAEVRQHDLRFAAAEVAALIAATGRAADAEQLLTRTGGWAAGLRLALNSAEYGQAGHVNPRLVDRHVFDYLAAEVLDEMPSELREFLVRCSVLPELTARRCAVVTGNPRAAQLLEEIERRGLFVSVVEAPEPALTLHDLFRACLEERLRREHEETLPALLRRAAETEPDPIRRLSFLLRAGAWDEAEVLLETVAAELVAAGAIEPVLRLLGQFPVERTASSPMLAFVRGQVMWARWDWREAAELMRRAAAGFSRSGDARRLRRAELYTAIALDGNGLISESAERLAQIRRDDAELPERALALALRTWHAIDRGDFRVVADCYTAVLDVLEQTSELSLWYECFQRPLYVWLPGMRAPLVRFVDGVMRRNGDTPSQMRAIAYVMAAWLALWRGELAQAEESVARAEEDAQWLGMPARLRMFVNTVRAAVSAARGERAATRAALESLLEYFASASPSGPSAQPTSMLGHYLLYAARLADTIGDAAAVRAFAARVPPPHEITNFTMLRAPLATLPARLAFLDGRAEEACMLWRELLEDEASLDVLGLAQESRARFAHALLVIGRRGEAATELKPLLRAVADTGEVGGMLLAGSGVLAALAAAPWRNELEWTELALLRGCAERIGVHAAASAAATAERGASPLSQRELEVLARIAAGDSNKLIARSLELSPHTVKRHVANILDKLSLSSRGQAAQWYRTHR